jgi:hypothetical protein
MIFVGMQLVYPLIERNDVRLGCLVFFVDVIARNVLG